MQYCVSNTQEMCAEFWPGEVGVPMEIGYMKISLTNTVHNEQFDEHKLSISVEVSTQTTPIHYCLLWYCMNAILI